MYESLTLAEQWKKSISRYSRPLAFPTAVVFPFQVPRKGSGNILDYRFYAAERLKGANTGHVQLHHGGFIDPERDVDPEAGARNELFEETGMRARRTQSVGVIGPHLPHSTMKLVWNTLVVTQSAFPANSLHPFVFNVFATNLTRTRMRNIRETDKELRIIGWMTLRTILDQWKDSDKFNYPELLIMTIRHLMGLPQVKLVSAGGPKKIRQQLTQRRRQ